MAVNQKQIAEKLGVSIALVSRVLSGKAAEIGISPDTIERVLKTAQKMGYVPSAAALSLKGKSTRTVGVAVYDFNDPFFGALIKQIQSQAHEHNYSLVLAGFLNRTPDEQDLQSLHKHAIDGLIILGSDVEANWVRDFSHLPKARIGHGSDSEKSVRITIDEERAARQLVEHLIKTGRKKMLCLSGNQPAHKLRQAALQKEAATAGMPMQTLNSEEEDPFSAGHRLIQNLPDIASRTDALVCVTDQIAMGALHALYDTGIRVPEDLAVTGFDDIPVSEKFIPPITTIRQPIEAMVQQAFDSIIQQAAPGDIVLPGQLIIRKST
jgi:DNA-binding LacI/PurR family transcriptional regulator